MWRCARWSSTSPAARCRRASCPTRSSTPRAPATCSSRSTPAACAAPTCTSATARCAARGCRWSRAIRSSPPCWRRAPTPRTRRARAWASRGWAGPTGRAASAPAGARTSASAPRFTGLDRDGGYATRAVADARYAFALPEGFGDLEAAPLLCAGLIGHRALRMTGDAAAPRALRLRRQRAHRLPGRAASGPARLRLHARRRRGLAGLRAASSAASGRATRWARRPRSSTRRSSSPPSASSSRRRCARWGAAAWSCARAST